MTCEIINKLFSLRQSYFWVRCWSYRHWDAVTRPEPIQEPPDNHKRSPHPEQPDQPDHRRHRERPKLHRHRDNLPDKPHRHKDQHLQQQGRLAHRSPFRTGNRFRRHRHQEHRPGLRIPSPTDRLRRQFQKLHGPNRLLCHRLAAGQLIRDL